jgi:hypothetical protein
MSPCSRKDFLRLATFGGSAAFFARNRLVAAAAPAGSANGNFSQIPSVTLVALCDVDTDEGMLLRTRVVNKNG